MRNSVSDELNVNCRVAQGTILDLNVDDLFARPTKGIIIAYADDTVILYLGTNIDVHYLRINRDANGKS